MMKKQLVSILFALCMVLCLVPLAAFAEGETVQEVTDQTTLFAAVAVDSSTDIVKLTSDITISDTLTVKREVTLDLNGFVLKYQNDSQRGSVIKVTSGGSLTLTDSDAKKVHKFDKSVMPWTLATDATAVENIVDVPGGIITGGTGTVVDANSSCGGGVYIDINGSFTMTGGSIVGCTANWCGGGVFVDGDFDGNYANFSMSEDSLIAGCLAGGSGTVGVYGGGIYNIGKTELSGSAKIQACNAVGAKYYNYGGGIYNGGDGSMTTSGNVTVIDCDVAGQSNVMNITGVCNISGGTFYGAISSRLYDGSSITGGTFYGNINGNFFSYVQEDSATVSVTFTADDGSTLDAQKVLRGQKATTPTDPTQTGYTFGGWYNGTEVYDFNQPVTEPITLTAKWLTGEGTAKSPILISNAEELKAFHDIVNGENGRTQKLDACATLTADIVLNDGTFDEDGNYTPGPSGIIKPTEWTFIGYDYLPAYSGTFDGAGHTIQGVYCIGQRDARAGLFGYVSNATIKNVKVTGYIKNYGLVGGIAAYVRDGTSITGCVNAATVIATGMGDYYPSAGGIVGRTEFYRNQAPNQITDCINTGIVRAIAMNGNYSYAGGILGESVNSTLISNCSNFGAVSGGRFENATETNSYVGGIAGRIVFTTVSDCYNVGVVTDTANPEPTLGGIVGILDGTTSLVNSYNVGSVTATSTTATLGGVAGSVSRYNNTITNCYYLTDTAGQACGKNDGVITNTTEKSAFDFANGGVLALLMTNHQAADQPWDTTCKYLESTGMTLPVFARQNLTVHDHVWSAYTTDTAAKTHTHSCACGVVETKACTITPATCKDGSACAVCGQQYGGPDTGKHADLQHFPAVAATTDAEGNKEYWYCGGCGKYFTDAAATREITRADTVTAKLPQPTTPPTASPTAQPTTAPQAAEQPRRTAQPTVQPTAAPTVQPVSTIPATGDTSSPILWAALLLCSGVGLAVTAYKKNKHRS